MPKCYRCGAEVQKEGYCKECNKLRIREWRAKNIKKIQPPSVYHEFFRKQGGRCAGCLKDNNGDKRFVIDHNHQSGENRGLLCHSCNLALGSVKDNPSTLRRLADYLEGKNPEFLYFPF